MSYVTGAHIEWTGSEATPGDYLALLKPRVMSLVVFTALAGLLMAPGPINPLVGFMSLLLIAVGAGASGALNMWVDSDIDAIMSRTQKRPIPAGKISRDQALAFGLTLSVFSVALLGIVANIAAAALLAFTIFFYVVIYSMWLKRLTPQNIVIGGAAGAFPPMVGYVAATGHVSLASVVLFSIIFLWTPPHFWALALLKSEDYAKAGIPMMPNAKGADRTRLEILLYTLLLVPVAVVPWLMGAASVTYGIIAMVAGALMLVAALRVYKLREGAEADLAAKQLFAFSILYLSLLFAEFIAEHGLGLASGLL